MRAAADNLTPVTLELGGKSPVIVHDTYDLAEAAQRVMAVKLRSAGQICLAPDYALVPAGSEREFAEQCVAAAHRMYPDGLGSVDYTSIINDVHFARLERLVADADARGAKVLNVFKLARPASARRMMPVVILNPPRDTLVMRDEIFGPIRRYSAIAALTMRWKRSDSARVHWLSTISERTMSGFARCSTAPLRAA
jgi:coniferyl-aldehyde dehydrogenase